MSLNTDEPAAMLGNDRFPNGSEAVTEDRDT